MRHVGLGDLEPGPWWIACQNSERAVNDWCVWSWDCDPCMLHLITAARVDPERSSQEFTIHGDPTTTSVAATLTAARAWRAEHGLREL